MWLSTHHFSVFLQDWFHVFLYEIKNKISVVYIFFQGTSVSITFYIFVHFQLWMMDSKAQSVFFPNTPKLCVWHTEVRNCYHFKLVNHFQLWFPIWGVQANRLMAEVWLIIIIIIFYLSHTRLYREYITSSEMYSLHLTHSKWTHTQSSGQPCYSARGAVGGSVPCSRTPQSWYWRRRERWLLLPHQQSLPDPRFEPTTFGLQVQLSNH